MTETCPKRNFLGHGARCIRRAGHNGDCVFPAGLGVETLAGTERKESQR